MAQFPLTPNVILNSTSQILHSPYHPKRYHRQTQGTERNGDCREVNPILGGVGQQHRKPSNPNTVPASPNTNAEQQSMPEATETSMVRIRTTGAVKIFDNAFLVLSLSIFLR